MKKRTPIALTAVMAVVAGLMLSPANAASDVGMWLAPFSEGGNKYGGANAPDTIEESQEFPTAVSLVILPDGNVAYWNGLQGIESSKSHMTLSIPEDQNSKTRHLDLSSYFSTGSTDNLTWSNPTPEDGGGGDLFCSDQRLLADGRVFAVGGTWWQNEDAATTDGTPLEGIGRTELYGRTNTRFYDHASNTWTQGQDMFKGRWYPTMVTMPDGKLFVASGFERLIYNSSTAPNSQVEHEIPQNIRETEVYDPTTGQWSLNTNPESEVSLPLYARLKLMPNGQILFDGTGQMWGPSGHDPDQGSWNFMKWYDPATRTWSQGELAPLGARNGSFSVMLPLKPESNWEEAQILIGGGTLGTPPGYYVGTPLSELLTVNGNNVSRRLTNGQMNTLRWFSSGVALPTGEVLALNGSDLDEVVYPGTERAVRTTELYNPDTQTWSVVASSQRDRTYHNSAILLKDGTVLVGGHSPINNGYGPNPANGPAWGNNFKDPSFEIYKPPYLFRGDRPEINSVSGSSDRGGTLTLDVDADDVANGTLKVAFSRLGATTHITDADQRTVWANVTVVDGDTVTVTVPDNANVMPGGYYYLFLMKDNGQGLTPSVAEIVKVSN